MFRMQNIENKPRNRTRKECYTSDNDGVHWRRMAVIAIEKEAMLNIKSSQILEWLDELKHTEERIRQLTIGTA